MKPISLTDLKATIEAATPGDWTPDPDGYAMYVFDSTGNKTICEMRGFGAKLPQEANRNAIIAAHNSILELVEFVQARLAVDKYEQGETETHEGWTRAVNRLNRATERFTK